MSRRPDPARITTARQEAVLARLIGAGHGSEQAMRLVGEWLSALGRPPTRADWDGFDAWLEARSRRAG